MIKRKKKGQVGYGIIIFALIVIVVMFLGLAIAIGGAVIDWGADEIAPALSSLGVVGSTNLTEVASYTVTPVNNFIQNIGWIVGVMYFIMLLGALLFAFAYRSSGNKLLIVFFFVLVIVIVLVSIFVSNAYENIYSGNGEMATRLQDMGILSFLIIQSPVVMLIIALIAGMIMFTPSEQEVYV